MDFYHTTCLFESGNPQRKKIYDAALKSWKNLGIKDKCVHEDQLERSSLTELGDKDRKLNFLKDIVNYDIDKLRNKDCIVLSNLDIFVCEDFVERATELLQETSCFFVQRKDIFEAQIYQKLTKKDLEKIPPFGINVDVACFTKKWWLKNRDDIPDFLLGAELWDITFTHFVKRSAPKGAPLRLDDCIYHVRHHDTKAYTNTKNPSSVYNRKIAVKALSKQFGVGYDKRSLWLNQGFTQHMVENFGFKANICRKGSDKYFYDASINQIST